jgi:hypothetical protein
LNFWYLYSRKIFLLIFGILFVKLAQNCKFKSNYYDYERQKHINFNCDEEPLSSGLCIFHDEGIQKISHKEEYYQKIKEKFNERVKKAADKNETLLCIGFSLPSFVILGFATKEFANPVYFVNCHF